MSFSNTPISRVVRQNFHVTKDFGGVCWNPENGMFFSGDPEPMPLREPYPAHRRPTEGRRRRK